MFNFVHFRYTSICLTKLDILDTLPKIQIGVGYRLNDKEIDYFPSSTSDLGKVTVIYETINGWQSTTEGVRSLEKLPSNARKYIQLIEEHLNIPGNISLNIYQCLQLKCLNIIYLLYATNLICKNSKQNFCCC